MLVIGESCVSSKGRHSDKKNLFKSSEFTPVNSFTHGVEGPAVDKYGNVYAVNFSHEGTIGIITPSGKPGCLLNYRIAV